MLNHRAFLFPLMLVILLAACRQSQPSIEFTKVPHAAAGTPFKIEPIEGRVTGVKPGQRVVLYAHSGVWWVQPYSTKPFTAINADATWTSVTHPGTEYAALLVDASYNPAPITHSLPAKGGLVAAIATAKGEGEVPANSPVKTVRFSGYDWELRSQSTRRGGTTLPYSPENVAIDSAGLLHLRTAQLPGGQWAGAEVRLTQSLGQGLYRFTVRDLSKMGASSGLAMFTWDDLSVDQHHREVDMEVGRWVDPAGKRNAEYMIHPSDDPANVIRYEIPAGLLTFSFRWEPGRALFKTEQGKTTVASHEFTSGVPSPGGEHVNISVFEAPKAYGVPLTKAGMEAIIEKFEYVP